MNQGLKFPIAGLYLHRWRPLHEWPVKPSSDLRLAVLFIGIFQPFHEGIETYPFKERVRSFQIRCAQKQGIHLGLKLPKTGLRQLIFFRLIAFSSGYFLGFAERWQHAREDLELEVLLVA